jgi:hypothetical protein
MIRASRLASLALTAGVLAAGGVAIYAVFFRGATTPSRASQAPSVVAAVPEPTPTVGDDSAGDRAKADQVISSSAPTLEEVISEVESSNVDGLMSKHLGWTSSPCTPPGQISNTVSPCTDLGVPVGTVVRMLPRNVQELWWQPEQDIRTNFDLYLVGTHPTLELVAKKDDGSYFLSFGIDGRHAPGETFDNVRIMFRTDAKDPGLLTEYALGADISTPLETIRMDEHYGETPMYDVIYISSSLSAKEQAWHDIRKAQDQETPTNRGG